MADDAYRRDIEEVDEELDAPDDGQPVEFWEQKQRELVTSVVDYNLGSLSDLLSQGVIDLSPRYQRRFRWNKARQSRLIESFLMNVPVPPIFLNEDEYGHYSVIDGKQRLTAIHEFFRGRLKLEDLKVFGDINGQTIDDLPPRLKQVLRTRPTVRAVIILRQSDEDVKFEVFQRLNTGGVRLNPQEIRNSAYPGPLNDLILDLSEDKRFHRLLGVRTKAKSAIYQEMRDAEFVLRFFTFRTTWRTFKGGMKRHMDHYMASNQHMKGERLTELRTDFLQTIETVDAAFGDHAFRRWLPGTGKWKNQVLAALYDAQMFGAREFTPNQFEGKRKAVERAQKALFDDDEFATAISAATNTPTYFKKRIAAVRDMLTGAQQV
jgi:hypothetical protein